MYPAECAEFVRALHSEYRSVLTGAYDRFAFASFEKAALDSFKSRYSTMRRYAVDEIGFEDYFLLFELAYNKLGKTNPEAFHTRGVLRRMFLDAVFDGGAIQKVHERFPKRMPDWLSNRDLILTTNYDSNLESVSSTDILHLHGAFDVLSDVYDPASFRNQLSEDLLDGEKVDRSYPHLYSSCLLSYVSDLKSFSMQQATRANAAMEKFAEAYRDDPQIRVEIDAWDESMPLLRRMREAIRLKCDTPGLEHREQYPVEGLQKLSGELAIIGLSPTNDNHIFEEVAANDGIDAVDYYFHSEANAAEAAERLEGKIVRLLDVRDLWQELETL